jgi:hypothetical protein
MGKENLWGYPYNSVWITDQETFSIVLPNVLVDDRGIIVMLRGSNDMVIQARPDFEYTNDPSGATYKISLTISSW